MSSYPTKTNNNLNIAVILRILVWFFWKCSLPLIYLCHLHLPPSETVVHCFCQNFPKTTSPSPNPSQHPIRPHPICSTLNCPQTILIMTTSQPWSQLFDNLGVFKTFGLGHQKNISLFLIIMELFYNIFINSDTGKSSWYTFSFVYFRWNSNYEYKS